MTETISMRDWVKELFDAERREREATRRGDEEALKTSKAYYEKRLSDLNGEASRIQTVLSSTVQKDVFDGYVKSERERAEAQIKTQRDRLDSYMAAQDTSFKLYADEMAKWRATVSIQMARWAAGLTVLMAIATALAKFA